MKVLVGNITRRRAEIADLGSLNLGLLETSAFSQRSPLGLDSLSV